MIADGLLLFWVGMMSFIYYLCARSRLLLVGKVHPDSYDYHVSKNTGTFFRWGFPFFLTVGILIGFGWGASGGLLLFFAVAIVLSRLHSKRFD